MKMKRNLLIVIVLLVTIGTGYYYSKADEPLSINDCSETNTTIKGEYYPGDTFTIPVVIHNIYGYYRIIKDCVVIKEGTKDPVDESVTESVIAALNQNFAGANNVDMMDSKIRFVLAHFENIEVNCYDIPAGACWFTNDPRAGVPDPMKEELNWDPEYFLNIYTGYDWSNDKAGFSTVPWDDAGDYLDGVRVATLGMVGVNTLTHEIGHYLGLFHPWYKDGCDQANSYTKGDLIADTNPQAEALNGKEFYCSEGHTSCGSADPVDNFMNYQHDKTPDGDKVDCRNRYTNEQINRMRCAFFNYRVQLGTGTPETVFSPDAPAGPNYGDVGVEYTFSIGDDFGNGKASNNMGHDLEYQFDWGDGTLSDWYADEDPETPVIDVHTWNSGGTYSIKARARCKYHKSIVSNWSEALSFSTGSITVTSPNGGEVWLEGTYENITWNSQDLTGLVDLLLVKTNVNPPVDYLIEEHVKNDGVYNWKVGWCTHIDGRGYMIPGNNFKVKIVSADNPGIMDESDQKFTLIDDPAITVTYPNGGEILEICTFVDLTWTSVGTVENVKIEFSKDNGATWKVIEESTENDGIYRQYIPEPNVSDMCLIRISDADDGDAVDVSDAVFSIILPPEITVLSPNGGEQWLYGTVQNITWDHQGLTNNLKIALVKNGTAIGLIADDVNPASGAFTWTVGQYIGGSAAAGSDYKIKIKEIGVAVSDLSNAEFTLTN